MVQLIQECWAENPNERPVFPEIVKKLTKIQKRDQIFRASIKRVGAAAQKARALLATKGREKLLTTSSNTSMLSTMPARIKKESCVEKSL